MAKQPARSLGAAYVAFYLGVPLTTLHNWVKKPHIDFPSPDHVVIGLRGKNSAFSWDQSGLPALRVWVERKKEMDPADAKVRWAAIDQELAKEHGEAPVSSYETPDIHPGQISITIPIQRTAPGEAEAA